MERELYSDDVLPCHLSTDDCGVHCKRVSNPPAGWLTPGRGARKQVSRLEEQESCNPKLHLNFAWTDLEEDRASGNSVQCLAADECSRQWLEAGISHCQLANWL